MKISLVVVVDEGFGIGIDNQLLCHLPADLRHFKQLTLGKPVLMGRKTFESIGTPLKGRPNVVLTRQKLEIEGVTCVATLEEAWAGLKDSAEVMVIGGAQLFEQTLALASEVYLTQIHHRFEADVFFPRLDPAIWERKEIGAHPMDDKHPYPFTFYVYSRL